MDRTPGLTLDSGALIAVERNKRRAVALIKAAIVNRMMVTIPTPVIAEAWRGGSYLSPLLRDLYDHANRDSIDDALAKRAGEALAATGRADTIDALVMASASRRGDRVLTGDFEDLTRFADCFPEVRVLSL
ncbi:MAG: PIN domain-containing protein [Egibacteraceae bacterium]